MVRSWNLLIGNLYLTLDFVRSILFPSNSSLYCGIIITMMVRGVPGRDYPIHNSATDTDFSCNGRVPGAYYADPSLDCQVGLG